ncbi:MAG TPA: hypothetical protein VHV83_16495, partial [Armatimonadota bacterium]|nr:hypothetical protein [Armatimonadota bacterium]
QKVNGVSKEESAHLLKWFVDLIVENHDLQVRFRWQNPNDLGKDIHISLVISDTNILHFV